MAETASEASNLRLSIVIVGGGLGGLAAAGYLRKHHDVVVRMSRVS